MDFAQPDSTIPGGEEDSYKPSVLGDNEALPATDGTACLLPEKIESSTAAKKSTEETVEKSCGGCPLGKFFDHLGRTVPQNMQDIFVWKDVYKSAVIFFTILPLLVLYCYCNTIVVTAYLLLGLTTSTFTYRIYRYVLDSLQKSEVIHPFNAFPDLEIGTSRQVVNEWLDCALPFFVRSLNKMKRYVLVYDIIDTVKFAVFLYSVAVIGGYFSIRFLLVFSFVSVFTLPKVYSIYKVQINDAFDKIDHSVGKIIREARDKVMSLKATYSGKTKAN